MHPTQPAFFPLAYPPPPPRSPKAASDDAGAPAPQKRTVVYRPLADVLQAPLPTDAKRLRRLRQWPAYIAWSSAFAADAAAASAVEGEPERRESVVSAAVALARSRAVTAGLSSDPDTMATAVNEALVREFVCSRGVALVPVAAVLGGLMGSEALKAVSARDEPVDNMLFFDGMCGSGGLVLRV